jgi:hypothetical protein
MAVARSFAASTVDTRLNCHFHRFANDSAELENVSTGSKSAQVRVYGSYASLRQTQARQLESQKTPLLLSSTLLTECP